MGSKDICKACGSVLAELTPTEVGQFLLKRSMWTWEEFQVGTVVDVEGLGSVEVAHNDYLKTFNDDDGGYQTMKFVWKTRVGFFAIEGGWSSYNGSEWTSEVKPAEKKTREVIYFE